MTTAGRSGCAEQAAARDAAGLQPAAAARGRPTTTIIDLAGNDYLGLSRDPRVVEAAAAAAARAGAPAPAPRGW